MFQISQDLLVESSLKVSEAGPSSVRVLRSNLVSNFQYRSFGRQVDRVRSKVKLDPTGIHY